MIRQYKILEKLGKGTFGIVYKVINEYESMIYVIKQISLNGLSKQQINQVYSEAKILSLINSKYVVKYRESFVDGEDLDIVMEYCDNGDLCNFLKHKKKKGIPLEEDLIWQIFIKITLGLTAIHKMKILHRDLKTLNIFLNKDMGIKIGDLGVAKELNQASFAKTLIGTPYYLSPEMCQDMPYNQKSDVWALGCILYELCTFRHPFNATNQGALIIKILNSNPEPIFNCYSSQLQYLVNQILEKNYEKRPNCWDLLNNPIIVEKAKQFSLYQDILDIFSYNNIITQNDYNRIVNISKNKINRNNLDCVPLDSENILFGQKVHVEKINQKGKKNVRENKNNHNNNNRNNCLSVDKNKNKIKYTDISNLNLVNNISYSNIYTHNENNNANYNQFENQKENYYLNNIIINQNNVFDNKNKYFYPNKTEIFPKNFINNNIQDRNDDSNETSNLSIKIPPVDMDREVGNTLNNIELKKDNQDIYNSYPHNSDSPRDSFTEAFPSDNTHLKIISIPNSNYIDNDFPANHIPRNSLENKNADKNLNNISEDIKSSTENTSSINNSNLNSNRKKRSMKVKTSKKIKTNNINNEEKELNKYDSKTNSDRDYGRKKVQKNGFKSPKQIIREINKKTDKRNNQKNSKKILNLANILYQKNKNDINSKDLNESYYYLNDNSKLNKTSINIASGFNDNFDIDIDYQEPIPIEEHLKSENIIDGNSVDFNNKKNINKKKINKQKIRTIENDFLEADEEKGPNDSINKVIEKIKNEMHSLLEEKDYKTFIDLYSKTKNKDNLYVDIEKNILTNYTKKKQEKLSELYFKLISLDK